MSVSERISELRAEAEAAIASAGGTAELEELRVRYLGRRSELTSILRGIAELAPEERGPVGKGANEARQALEAQLEARAAELDAAELEAQLAGDRIDVTLPGAPARRIGHLHLVTRTRRLIEDVMAGLGYRVMEGPEIEHDYYNFTALNHPPGHPARMLQDTFYVAAARRTSCCAPTPRRCRCGRWRRSRRRSSSSSPARSTGATPTPPTARCSTRSRAWRSPRASPSPTSRAPCSSCCGRSSARVARPGCGPHYFPFTEPSVEFDVSCFACDGSGALERRLALRALQGDRLDRGRRSRDGRPERARLRRRERL